MERIGQVGLVPVVVLENSEDAPKIGQALLEGGVPIMEITMRTEAGIDAIKAVKQKCPDVIVGAGTVLTLEKCKEAVEAGASFIVTPGFNPKVVDWCVENRILITPGCVTPTEIEMALSRGIKTVKFFPAGIYGGIEACAAFQGPYKSAGLKFIPTGGINLNNLDEYSDKPFIHAIGGGWLCDSKAVAAGDYDIIRNTAEMSVNKVLGFEVEHVGINTANSDASAALVQEFNSIFGFAVKNGNSSNFAGKSIEVMKYEYLGRNGHIAIRTNNIERALYHLKNRGYESDETTSKQKNGQIIAIYLKHELGGFAIHLVQK